MPEQLVELVLQPIREVPAAVRAAVDGIRFAAAGTRAHVRYPIRPVIDYLRSDDAGPAAA